MKSLGILGSWYCTKRGGASGGNINDDEGWDVVALRELYEETGLLGTAASYDDDLIDGGVVVLVEVDDSPFPEPGGLMIH